MNTILYELSHHISELCESEENKRRKQLWIKHNNHPGSTSAPINVHLWKTLTVPLSKEIIPDEELKCTTDFERNIERLLRQRIFKFTRIDDDDVILPTIWLTPQMKKDESTFGLKQNIKQHGISKKYTGVIENAQDLTKIVEPSFEQNNKLTQENISLLRELTGDVLPIKIKTPILEASPIEYVAQVRKMDDLLYDFIDEPEFVHELMRIFTQYIINRFKIVDKAQIMCPEQTWDFRVHYDELNNMYPENSLKNCWVYISAQSSATISPIMYEEFIQPYHEEIANLFGKVYYHGCEDLTQKAKYIKNLPNLRRFHISPWSNPQLITQELGPDFIYEVHVHPANHLFLYNDIEIKNDIKHICKQCLNNNVSFDLNLSDIETINGDKNKLIKWSKLAREAVNEI